MNIISNIEDDSFYIVLEREDNEFIEEFELDKKYDNLESAIVAANFFKTFSESADTVIKVHGVQTHEDYYEA